MDLLAERLPETFSGAEVATEHGVRLSFADGSWVLVRPSGTEPYLRVYVESDDVDEVLATVTEIAETAVEAAETDT
jgi:phosphomannomutase